MADIGSGPTTIANGRIYMEHKGYFQTYNAKTDMAGGLLQSTLPMNYLKQYYLPKDCKQSNESEALCKVRGIPVFYHWEHDNKSGYFETVILNP